jgi:Fe-S-cluster containining protein
MNLDAVRRGHLKLDEAISKVIASEEKKLGKPLKLPCRRGCSACCYEPVYADKTEAALALEAMSKMPVEQQDEIKARVKDALEKFKASGMVDVDMPPVIDYLKLRIPCPFLDLKSGDCTIYESRPLGCRAHVALKPKDFCEDYEKRLTQKYMYVPELTGIGVIEIAEAHRQLIMDHYILLLAELLGIEWVKSASRQVVHLTEDDRGSPIFPRKGRSQP